MVAESQVKAEVRLEVADQHGEEGCDCDGEEAVALGHHGPA